MTFADRHIGPNAADIAAMLDTVGVESLDALIDRAVPSGILNRRAGEDDGALSEEDALARLTSIAARNTQARSLIGMGYTDTVTPQVIARNVLQNPGWYTAYTPYQPEISQGRLEALITFQQMVMDLTALPLANASLLDEATAAAEAMTLARRAGTSPVMDFLVSDGCHPQTIAVLETRAEPLGIRIVTAPAADLAEKPGFGILLQYPETTGQIEDLRGLVQAARDDGKIICVAADLLALTLLAPPGEWGADIVIGAAQRFGVPLGYGGPHAAFMAARENFKRSLPGRIVGVSADSRGRKAYRLALQTREQHIRREKATSNICTAQVLLANVAAFYAVYHGKEGLVAIARRIAGLTALLAEGLARLDLAVRTTAAFDTLTVEAGPRARDILARARAENINLRDYGDGRVGMTLDEKSTAAEVFTLWQVFSGQSALPFSPESLGDMAEKDLIPEVLRRQSDFLSHPVFRLHRSETEMMRYLKRLENRDISLTRSMIPLGSCTMKLNAAAEMAPISWPAFCDIHPFAPDDQTEGYRTLLRDLEEKLCRLTGFDALSLQPNAGSQGEYAGLLVIRAFHRSRGEGHRTTCLIPASAHGTNPASAVMAGMEVVVVACDADGNISLEDLKAKAEAHRDTLAALMVTYPSTHGVFEEEIREICTIVHDCGGQVYMDGANFNALVGLALPADFGADVMHMNLHKTFCIPHGGGGPGMGPIGVRAHLAPFLPGHPQAPSLGGAQAIGPVAAAPYGSASILPISWMYLAMMGGDGLRRATAVAILNANYLAARLKEGYDTLYTGPGGFVAHECIIDTRPFKAIGITVDDIAKRLMDFGFHAPTMSFPVPGTLMIEPTESESKAELDRFADALLAIRREIDAVAEGRWPQDDNPLVQAPHTLADLVAQDWDRAYDRAQAFTPAPWVAIDKYLPPVNRIDHAAGDRTLVCACPPIDSYT